MILLRLKIVQLSIIQLLEVLMEQFNITARFNVSSFNPDNFLIENNTLTSLGGNGGQGVYIGNSGSSTVGITFLKIGKNTIFARATRAITFNYVNDGDIYGNTISLDNQFGTGCRRSNISYYRFLSWYI
jgi:hypothetical protein